MITQLSESEGHVLGVRISGKVSSEMEKEWIGKLEKVIKEHGKSNILILFDKHATWGLKAGIDDLKWILTNMKKICKIAIVADCHFWKWYVALDSPFGKVVGIGEKYFNPAEMDAAWKWLKE